MTPAGARARPGRAPRAAALVAALLLPPFLLAQGCAAGPGPRGEEPGVEVVDPHAADVAAAREVLEAHLRLPPRAIDPALVSALATRMMRPDAPVFAILHEADRLAARVRERLAELEAEAGRGARAPGAAAARLATALDQVTGLEVDRADPQGERPENLDLDRVIERGRGHCLALSVVYAAVAWRLDLPLHVVRAADHVFVRWDDGEGPPVALETTARGGPVAPAMADRPALTPHELAAEILLNRATYVSSPVERRRGLALADLAVAQAPARSAGWLNRGWLRIQLGDPAGALPDLERAAALEPSALASYNLGVATAALGRLAEARRHFEATLARDQGYVAAILNLAAIDETLGRRVAAREGYERALRLDPANRAARRALDRLDDPGRAARAEP